eukprot:1335981-Amorphochlora_amoeboformis.AAC.2
MGEAGWNWEKGPWRGDLVWEGEIRNSCRQDRGIIMETGMESRLSIFFLDSELVRRFRRSAEELRGESGWNITKF